MTRKTTVIGLAAVAALIALSTERASAQAAAATPAAPVPHVAPSPPPTPPKVVVPASALPPSDSAVALCKNGSWIYNPGTAADCAQRGGLQVAMPKRAAAAPLTAAAATMRASIIAPAKLVVAPPTDATMQCKDGTYLSGPPSAGRCAALGGVAALFPVAAKPVPVAPRRP